MAALELLILERLALDDPARLVALEANIAAGLRASIDPDERTIRQAALDTIHLAVTRFDEFTEGRVIRKE